MKTIEGKLGEIVKVSRVVTDSDRPVHVAIGEGLEDQVVCKTVLKLADADAETLIHMLMEAARLDADDL